MSAELISALRDDFAPYWARQASIALSAEVAVGYLDRAQKAREAADALASKDEEIKRLRKIACLARDVSLAATQDDAGRWIITGDAELMLGDLYLAVEAPEVRQPLQGDANVSR